ncbi:glycosyltransferase family 2 protein [Mycoavidus sp. SF9855]|uniref:glycosyltransferase family 2 protein n=1 Tax=Mycoavidus sp. SF9855 TaxID=2968475 RepID=UPI00211C8739|nr:glycosyltransferase family 2 protein [Mycoavidus sp. SF9855]UUM21144.1 glycosyltransferase family 2 protein [Mycoavidus sp. SF9855]
MSVHETIHIRRSIESAANHVCLSVSVVTFNPNPILLQRTLDSLRYAVAYLRAQRGQNLSVSVLLVNNGSDCISDTWASVFKQDAIECKVIAGHGNIGYGRGHNLAIESLTSDYHLILNPDVDMAENALDQALKFFDKHPAVALLAPHVSGEDNVTQYLCRRYPTVLDLFVRGFLWKKAQTLFILRLARYELHDLIKVKSLSHELADQTIDTFISPQIVSGCYMMFRTNVLKKLGGFDSRYFLYFEDYDLSLRAGAIASIAYVPAVRIVHFGGGASKKGWRHIYLFVMSAYHFFNRFGWRWL